MLAVTRMNRRTALARLAGSGLLAMTAHSPSVRAENPPEKTGLGMVLYNRGIRRRLLLEQNPPVDLFEPLTFLRHCRELHAGGMQAALGVLDREEVRQLREYAELHDLFIEAIVSPPESEADLQRFEAEIRTARGVGALAARTVIIPGRRYERFDSLAEFRDFAQRGHRMLERAVPIVEKHQMPLAVENHKDERNEERLDLFQRISSEYVGACIDTGNSFALLEDPIETIEAFAPWAFSVHLKDQGVREYTEGFLLGDIPLGQGCFDLKRMVAILRTAKPNLRFVLELITRDPLPVPCLTDRYWATMPDVPGRALAQTLRIVRRHGAESLREVSSRPLADQAQIEDDQIAASLRYAREHLRL